MFFGKDYKCWLGLCLGRSPEMTLTQSKRGSALSIVAAVLAVALIAVSLMAFVVYQPQIDQQNALITQQNQQIAHLNATIADQNTQITDLQGQLSDIRAQYTANLVTALGAKDMNSNETLAKHFYITGSVQNTGVTAAYHAGLHIVGYGSNHEVLINMTSPVEGGIFQTGFDNPQITSTVYPTQIVGIVLAIYHSGSVVSWDIQPVWSNSP